MNPALALRDALVAAVAFEPQGEPAGNVTVGRGACGNRPLRVAVVENRAASGAIGSVEAGRLVSMLQAARAEGAGVVLFLDSAGAKVSEGLRALGAFRGLYRAGLEAAFAGVPIAAVLGRNCFGGSSMLAHLAAERLFAPNTQLAMSGPAVIAASAGLDPLDEAFRAMAQAAMSAPARARNGTSNAVWQEGEDITAWLQRALAPRDPVAFRARHEALGTRAGKPWPQLAWEPVRRRELEKLYPEGYEAREAQGILEGSGSRGREQEHFIGLVGKLALDAGRAWHFAELAWQHAARATHGLHVYLDCASHAARLEDEKLVLTEYVVDMGLALAAVAANGGAVRTTVIGQAGGGVYVALAAPAARVASLHGANIQVLPGAAVAAILGESRESAPGFDEYRKASVADEEIKLGLVPGNA